MSECNLLHGTPVVGIYLDIVSHAEGLANDDEQPPDEVGKGFLRRQADGCCQNAGTCEQRVADFLHSRDENQHRRDGYHVDDEAANALEITPSRDVKHVSLTLICPVEQTADNNQRNLGNNNDDKYLQAEENRL